jgi:DnaJ family protein B protein 6
VFFNDPVFNDPIFTNPYFGSPYRNSSRTTLFTDPFTLFNSLFEGMGGGDDYLDPRWPYDRYDRDPFRFMSMGFPYGFGATFRSGFGGHRKYPESSLKTTSYQNRSPDGKPAHWVYENTMYRSVNGVTQVVTERRDSNVSAVDQAFSLSDHDCIKNNTHTYVKYPDGKQTYTINGIEQRIPRQPLEDGPALYEP